MIKQRFQGITPEFLASVAAPTPPRLPVYRRKPQRSVESRVFWGVFCALLVFSGISAVAYAVRVAVARAAIAQVQAQTMQEISRVASTSLAEQRQQQARQAVQEAYRQQQAAYERSRYVLASNQQCIGGTVVQIDGTTYTQLHDAAAPVRCTGNVANSPLR